MKRLGMVFILSVIAISSQAMATVHTITLSGMTFTPSLVTVEAGDTVRWVHVSGSHTVTNGTGSGDPEAGTVFDVPLNALSPVFAWEYPSAGVFPFFCRPHELFGMKGTVTVQDAPPPCVCANHADPNPDGVTNVLDVVRTVNVAFRGFPPVFDADCPYERTDVDCSMFSNVLDVVKMVNVAFRGMDSATQFCNPCP